MEKLQAAPMDTGIDENDRRRIAEALSRALADTYALYLKTQNYHWNVTGKDFFALHKAFEAQYEELAAATDDVAERIRALGYPVTATLSDFKRLTSIREDGPTTDAPDMVRGLIEGHQVAMQTLHAACKLAEPAEDQATLDLLGSRLRAHEKTTWMLRSMLA
ncbi:MAG: DNA starvation/stationary phase protection protein [Elusimicrobia bacterium]|nr:DNA starvation/stationary phase protection protein [Elusimicrobiota bacterium]